MPEDKGAPPLNLVLITIDSLRYDHLSFAGYRRETSPNIDSLAAEGTNHTSAFSHGGGTEEAFPTMLTGIPPPVNIDQCERGIRRGATIAEILRRKGYSTAAFNSNPYLSAYFGYDEGFTLFCHDLEVNSRRAGVLSGSGLRTQSKVLLSLKPPITRGGPLTEQFLTWAAATSRPFFGWIHYMDVHMPYLPPRRSAGEIEIELLNRLSTMRMYRKMGISNRRVRNSMRSDESILSSSDIRKITDFYDAAIRYVDECVGQLMQGLKEQGQLENTLIILTADHGEMLGEKGAVDHGYLYDPVLHVPLIIAGGEPRNAVVEQPVTHTKVFETMAVAAGIDYGLQRTKWKSFADPNPGIVSSVIYDSSKSYVSCRTTKWKYIQTTDLNSKFQGFELYDLASDPHETDNVANSQQVELDSLRSQVYDFILQQKQAESSHVAPASPPLSEEDERVLQERLRDLGYC